MNENWAARGCDCSVDPTPKQFWKGSFEAGIEDPGFRELYVRWLQFGGFLPMFRSHGADVPREIRNFGKPGKPFYDSVARFISLRYRLLPYIYTLSTLFRNDSDLQIEGLRDDMVPLIVKTERNPD